MADDIISQFFFSSPICETICGHIHVDIPYLKSPPCAISVRIYRLLRLSQPAMIFNQSSLHVFNKIVVIYERSPAID